MSFGSLVLLTVVGITRNFTAQNNNDFVWYSTNRCFSANTDMNNVWTFTKEGTISSKTTSGGLNAKAVFVRWQETDFQTPTTTTADSTATSTGSIARNTGLSSGPSATASTAAATSTAATDQSSDSSQGGSSKAWIAGPVIGVVVACALIAFAAAWYNRRRRRQKSSTEVDYSPKSRHHMPELLGDEPKVFEAPSGAIYPARGPVELPGTNHG